MSIAADGLTGAVGERAETPVAVEEQVLPHVLPRTGLAAFVLAGLGIACLASGLVLRLVGGGRGIGGRRL